eukprot:192043-Chlamydomonas_euryale.AAC.1
MQTRLLSRLAPPGLLDHWQALPAAPSSCPGAGRPTGLLLRRQPRLHASAAALCKPPPGLTQPPGRSRRPWVITAAWKDPLEVGRGEGTFSSFFRPLVDVQRCGRQCAWTALQDVPIFMERLHVLHRAQCKPHRHLPLHTFPPAHVLGHVMSC